MPITKNESERKKVIKFSAKNITVFYFSLFKIDQDLFYTNTKSIVVKVGYKRARNVLIQPNQLCY